MKLTDEANIAIQTQGVRWIIDMRTSAMMIGRLFQKL